MKQCKCKECGNIQNHELLNCEKCGNEMPKDIYKTKIHTHRKHSNNKSKDKIKIPWQGILMGVGNSIISLIVIAIAIDAGRDSIEDGGVVLIFAILPVLLAWGFLTRRRWAPVISLIFYIFTGIGGIKAAIETPNIKLSFLALSFVVFFIYCDLVCIGHPAYIKNKR